MVVPRRMQVKSKKVSKRQAGASLFPRTRRLFAKKVDHLSQDSAQSNRAFDLLRRGLRRNVERGRWPGIAACAFVDGKLRLLEERGYADVERKVPMSKNSLVRLYSMTKCIIGAAVLQLVEDKKLGLDDQLGDHLPAFKEAKVVCEGPDGMPNFSRLVPANQPITIRHLLTHTSGISCGLSAILDGPRLRGARERAWAGIYHPLIQRVEEGKVPDLATWVAELAQLPLVDHPGHHYGYGYSYDVLGYLIELKSGKALSRYLQENIFNPLGMSDTCFDLGEGARAKSRSRRLTVLYRYTKSGNFGSDGQHLKLVRVDPEKPGGKSRWARACRIPSGGGCLAGLDGGLLSSLEDYAKFLLAVLNGGVHPQTGARILSPQSAEEMLADQTAQLPHKEGGRIPISASPYDDRGLGLCCLGELQRKRAPTWGSWFDGVTGVRQWGGAASCSFKYDPNNGTPLLVVLMAQALPQDDGRTITQFLQGVREAAAAEKARK